MRMRVECRPSAVPDCTMLPNPSPTARYFAVGPSAGWSVRMTSESPVQVPEWLLTMPKVELHVHLEGTISPDTLWKLSRKHGVDLGVRSLDEAARLYEFSDFTHFIDVFTKCSDVLRAAEDLGTAVEAYGVELARQNVRYAEIHFNPEPHQRRRGIAMSDALLAMNAARNRIQSRFGIEMRWIADGVRNAGSGPVSVDRTVGWMIEAGSESGIVALGLGGNEIGHPPRDFEVAFARARDAGFHVVAHAGEATGPETIREAIDVLGAERIGHGLAAAGDPALLAYLAQYRIPLEISPTSNLRTRVVSSMDEHPLRLFVEAGIRVSINSDDPPMFGTDLVNEYALAAHALGLDRQGVAQMVLSAIDQSFADTATKARLRRELLAHTPFD